MEIGWRWLLFWQAGRRVSPVSTKAALASLILLTPGLLPAAEKNNWTEAGGEAADWKFSLPTWNTHRAVLVLDSPATTRLRGILLPAPLAATPMMAQKRVASLMESFQPATETGLVIEWLGGDPVKDFERSWQAESGQVRSVYQVGSTTITRTIFASAADDAVFIHLLADHPGALSFRVGIPEGDVRREDRGQLVVTPEKG
ncbi:MAG: hypothetical protein EOP87_19760, partial [Verrucomicrobiaceae bacterium]